MFGLYDPNTIPQAEFTPLTLEETYKGLLESVAEGKKDQDFELESFHDFLVASQVLMRYSQKQVQILLNKEILGNGILHDLIRNFVSKGGVVIMNILGEVDNEAIGNFKIRAFDGSSRSLISIHKKPEKYVGNIIIGDDNKSVYTNLGSGGNANFGSSEIVQQLEREYFEALRR